MGNKIEQNSAEYYLLTELAKKIKNASNDTLRETYKEGRLVYLDDEQKTLNEFVKIVDNLVDETYEAAPNHLKGRLKEIETDEIRDMLTEQNVTIYGRSGLKLNSKELRKYEEG